MDLFFSIVFPLKKSFHAFCKLWREYNKYTDTNIEQKIYLTFRPRRLFSIKKPDIALMSGVCRFLNEFFTALFEEAE